MNLRAIIACVGLLFLVGTGSWARGQDEGRRRVIIGGRGLNLLSANPDSKDGSTVGNLPIEGGYTGPEIVQQEISAYLDKQAGEQRKRLRERLGEVIEDMTRVLSLDARAKERLELAAAGAAERALDSQRGSMENHARSQARAAGPGTIKEVLQSVGSFSQDVNRVESEGLWKGSLTQVLTETQRQAWQRALQEREDYRRNAIVEMLLVGLDGAAGLSEEQANKLRPLAETAVREYLPDLSRYYSDQRIDFRMVLLFVSGMPEKETKAVLTPEQWKKWEEATAEYSGWWDGILRNHEVRIKTKTP